MTASLMVYPAFRRLHAGALGWLSPAQPCMIKINESMLGKPSNLHGLRVYVFFIEKLT